MSIQRHRCARHLIPHWLWALVALVVVASGARVEATELQGDSSGEILLEVFTRSDSEMSARAAEYARDLGKRTPGLRVNVYDVLSDQEQLARLWSVSKSSGREKPVVPAFRSCDRMHFGFASAGETGPKIQDLYAFHVYTRSTCPRCRNAKAFFARLQSRWPALRVKIYEITQDVSALRRWQELCQQYHRVPGLPTTLFAGQLIIGYQSDQITGKQYEQLLKRVCGTAPGPQQSKPNESASGAVRVLMPPLGLISMLQAPGAEPVAPTQAEFDDVPLPEEALPEDFGEAVETANPNLEPQPESVTDDDKITVPILGELSVRELGLPAFTFLVGLVDGFNPCAMWVLVFLLSVLVNIKDRAKILLIAGTFVLISGLAYYTFMAAWLNLYLLIGVARWIQITLGVMAILIGAINLKDFFAFKKGISLSIPESSKPGIYARVRKIVATEYLTVALMGAVVLAVVVNVVELLCTAGLPALYTQILAMHELPAWQNYAYLGLYIAAYMLDDTILLTIVIVTLSHRKLQEREGRWLKMLSGVVILVLGVVMIFKPEWMQLGQ
jgi:hypothetical protein